MLDPVLNIPIRNTRFKPHSKRCSTLLLLCLLSLWGCAERRDFALSCAEGNSLKACANRSVKLQGKLARNQSGENAMILQHPIMTSPVWPHQDYLQLSPEGQQVVLLSREALTCSDRISLTGRLDTTPPPCGGGGQGNCGYSGYTLYVENYRCN